MIAYRLLSDGDFNSLHQSFLAAFSDYEVDMQMSRDQFRQRSMRDGVRMEISAGAFDGDRMIGFCINSPGAWQGKQTAYDAGTAVVPGYRGRGIAKELFAFLVPQLKEAGVVQYLLEVLTSNVPAVKLYRKLGFVDTRRLAVFRPEPQKGTKDTTGVVVKPVTLPDWRLYQSFWDGYPSWQNSIDAVERVAGERAIIEAYVNNECIGYGAVFAPAASLMQLAVAREHRRTRIGSAILAALESSERLKINNIDENLTASLAFYKANGYKQVLNQYEMMKTL